MDAHSRPGSMVRAEHSGRVGVVHLDHPQSRNALSPRLMDELIEALAGFDADAEVRCIVIAGTRHYFAMGADLSSMADDRPVESGAEFWKRLESIATPVIAAVSGWALGGGCELALACDMIVASESAIFGQPETTLGVIPSGGATQRLTRILGRQRAMEIILTGRQIPAKQAKELGFVTEMVKEKVWLQSSLDLAERIAERPPIAARLAKQAVRAAEESSLSEGLEVERELFEKSMATEDRIEGMRAFLEQRPGEFEGR